MGRDMCGFIFVGPMKLARQKIKEAEEKLEKIRARIETLDPDDKDDEIDGIMHQLCLEDPYELKERLEDFSINDIVNVWDDQYRDSMSRYYRVGDMDKRILVCGDRTWGDGPEPDSAWGIMETADALGLTEILGLE